VASILITGGTGSFGNAAVRHFLKDKNIERLVIFSRDEKKQHDMRHQVDSPKVEFIVGDVRDRDAVLSAVDGIDYIFHAAALKHVPTGEFFPMEMVRTNILGTENLLHASEAKGVKNFVLLSTDKAVYPINMMGISKATAEKLVGAYARKSHGTIFTAVRYGNVMASRGSVIPLFIDCIKSGKSLPITDPSMTRFLLSLEDSIDLVKLAIKKGKQGDLFVKKAPAATIGDIAQALLTIFNAENRIKFIGVRAGEKIHETLATQLELSHSQDLSTHYRIMDVALSGYADFYDKGSRVYIAGDYTSENTERLTLKEVEKTLRSLPYVQAAMVRE
jgi:UDP-glucose 4-epimerase